jgi:hypothetical protein
VDGPLAHLQLPKDFANSRGVGNSSAFFDLIRRSAPEEGQFPRANRCILSSLVHHCAYTVVSMHILIELAEELNVQ